MSPEIIKPTYHDADLVLRVYEMRRETKTREARDLLNFQFWPTSYEDVKAVQQFEHPMNFAWRQLSTYWEVVFGLARNGIVHTDYLVENNGEGFFFFAKVEPYLDQIRESGSPRAFRNVEWATTATDASRAIYENIREAVRKHLAALRET